ncbi:hypothetical protein ESCO_006722 [Escovopsis weberi]|uniref:Protein BNS1 n=1 Tax=Escovopsis weberi TaxID=150374 RepID=A0A0N0RTV3_ESCWE|nr:hypothetical protein ESCO_006722 [Escovopsis weberi]
MSKVLGDKDVNAQRAELAPGALAKDKHMDVKDVRQIKEVSDVKESKEMKETKEMKEAKDGKDVRSMEYHRQVFRSKMAEEQSRSYVSPSDNIMSPASAKISALRNKSALKAKPKSLFAQASAKKLNGDSPLGAAPLGTRPALQ